MTKDDVIHMAREAGIEFDLIDEDEGQICYITSEGLERFAALVAAAERERACRIVTGLCISDNNAREINAAIRGQA
jgi:hypothetical protein